MRDRHKLLTQGPVGITAFAALVLAVGFRARAESPQMEQRALQTTAPRHSDAMPQPTTSTIKPQERQPPTIRGERPGYWQSTESVYPLQYPYVSASDYRWHRFHRPFQYLPHYQTYGNRRAPGVSQDCRGW